MEACCAGTVPHLWLIGPGGWVCAVGGHPFSGTADPYGPCLTANPWAVAGIRRAEEDSGLCVSAVAGSVGVTV